LDSVNLGFVTNPEVLDSLEEGWGSVDTTFEVSVGEVNLNIADGDVEQVLDLDSLGEINVGLINVLVDVVLEFNLEGRFSHTEGGLEVGESSEIVVADLSGDKSINSLDESSEVNVVELSLKGN